MNDQETVVAESSPAVAEPIEVEDLSAEQRETWTKTGELPTKEASPAVADSEPAKKEAKTTDEDAVGGKGAQKRIKELVARAKKAEEELAAAKRPAAATTPKTETTKTDAVESDGRPKKMAYPPRPQLKDCTSQEEYEDKLFAWRDSCKGMDAAYTEATQKWEKTEADIKEKLQAGLNRVNAKYPDNLDVVKPLFQKLVDQRASLPEITWFLNTTEVLPDLLYAFGGDFKFDEFLELGKTNPAKALRTLFSMEQDIIREIDKGTAMPKEELPEKKVTSALPPPKEIGGKGVAAEDEAEAALKSGDVDRYIEVTNAREIAAKRRKG